MLLDCGNGLLEFLKRDDGPTAVEYGLLAALIIVVVSAAMAALGVNAKSTFNSVSNTVNAGRSESHR